MFQNVDSAIEALNEIKVFSEDLATLSSFLLKTLTDEEFANNNINPDDLVHRKLIDEIFSSKEGIVKNINKLKRSL